MKNHMIGWKVVSIVLGILSLLGAAGNLLLQKYSAMLGMVLAGLALFATASVCAWMDEMLDNQRKLAALNRIENHLENISGKLNQKY